MIFSIKPLAPTPLDFGPMPLIWKLHRGGAAPIPLLFTMHKAGHDRLAQTIRDAWNLYGLPCTAIGGTENEVPANCRL
jgi:hypothetical protein